MGGEVAKMVSNFDKFAIPPSTENLLRPTRGEARQVGAPQRLRNELETSRGEFPWGE